MPDYSRITVFILIPLIFRYHLPLSTLSRIFLIIFPAISEMEPKLLDCIFRGFPQFFRLCWLVGWCLVSPVGGSGAGLLPLLLPGLALILLNIYFLALASAASRYNRRWAAVSLILIPLAEVLSSWQTEKLWNGGLVVPLADYVCRRL
jgi:hypothetical protein